MSEQTPEIAQVEVTYLDNYRDRRTALITEPGYSDDDPWEGVDYAARDTKSDLPITLRWDDAEGWVQSDA